MTLSGDAASEGVLLPDVSDEAPAALRCERIASGRIHVQGEVFTQGHYGAYEAEPGRDVPEGRGPIIDVSDVEKPPRTDE